MQPFLNFEHAPNCISQQQLQQQQKSLDIQHKMHYITSSSFNNTTKISALASKISQIKKSKGTLLY